MNQVVMVYLPFLTVAVFVVGMAYRIYVWATTSQPGAITLFPAPQGKAATFFGVIRESFLFPGVFRGDRLLWFMAWFFHATLALIFVGHIRVFTDFPGLWAALGINADRMSAVSGGVAGVIVMVMAVLLIVRRLAVLRVREVSNASDYLALLLIVAILVSGNAMRFGEHFDLEITRTYFSRLFTFSPASSSVPQNTMFAVHFLLAQALIMFIPFSKIMHFGGIFFTQTLIQRA